jgi:hypothetical protein
MHKNAIRDLLLLANPRQAISPSSSDLKGVYESIKLCKVTIKGSCSSSDEVGLLSISIFYIIALEPIHLTLSAIACILAD